MCCYCCCYYNFSSCYEDEILFINLNIWNIFFLSLKLYKKRKKERKRKWEEWALFFSNLDFEVRFLLYRMLYWYERKCILFFEKKEEEKQKLLWHSFFKLKQLNLLKEILYKKKKKNYRDLDF